MRSDRFEEKSTAESLGKTVYTSLIIAGLICFLGALFPVYLNQGNASGDLLSYYLTWSLPYGIPCLCFVIIGIAGLGNVSTNIIFKKNAGLFGIITGGLLMAGSFPLAIILQAWEFFISILVIGGCVLAMGILQLSAFKKGE